MVMHSGVKRTISDDTPPLVNMEHQQQTLLDLSIHKLHQEQIKYGIEPRLLRFVLINNALRSLQAHLMSRVDEIENDVLFCDQSSFLSNTFKHGYISAPPSPPTPIKRLKSEGETPTNHDLLLNGDTLPTLGCMETGQDRLETMPSIQEERIIENRLTTGCKRTVSKRAHENEDSDDISDGNDDYDSKRRKQNPLSLSDDILNGFSLSNSSNSNGEYISDDSNPLSPIDFAKVDVSLYDFDARTPLSFAPLADTPGSTPPSTLSCSLHAFSTGGPSTVDYSSSGSSSTNSPSSSIEGACDSASPSNFSLPSDNSEPDSLDDIDRIVSMLMA